MPYIERLADYRDELRASSEVASAWADELVETTRLALSPDEGVRSFFHGATACLSALFSAARYEEIVGILPADAIWPYRRWAVKAMVAMGRKSEAIQLAESAGGPWMHDADVDSICAEICCRPGWPKRRTGGTGCAPAIIGSSACR